MDSVVTVEFSFVPVWLISSQARRVYHVHGDDCPRISDFLHEHLSR